ncbi:MAG: hypothetical protein M3137_15255, partial [Actinomycetota bacterium]|nr:hypothetical protein [Actinomycetota bacterium]
MSIEVASGYAGYSRRVPADVIGRRTLPAHYQRWNQVWGAPFGRPVPAWQRRLPRSATLVERRAGPFSFQPNNSTRMW